MAAEHHDDHHGISHVATIKVLLGTGGALLFLTIVTVLATRVDVRDAIGRLPLARTDAWLAGLGDRLPALRRLVVEARDGVRRALAAQERDRA